MEELSSSETFLATHLTTRCRNPEEDTPNYPSPVNGVDLIKSRYQIIRSCMSVGQGEGEETNGLTLGNLMFTWMMFKQ
jgi:hypothetical protein